MKFDQLKDTSIPKLEEKVLNFWDEKKIFQKSLKKSLISGMKKRYFKNRLRRPRTVLISLFMKDLRPPMAGPVCIILFPEP